MSKLFKFQKQLRASLKQGQCIEYGTNSFKQVETFLRRHPGKVLGNISKIYADFGNSYDNNSRKKHLCWWVVHDLSNEPTMVGQKACQYPAAYKKAKEKEQGGQVVTHKLIKALRVSIRYQIEEFRQGCPAGVTCPITNKNILVKEGDSEVDHDLPDFKDLAKDFINEHPEFNWTTKKDDCKCEELIDSVTRVAWEKYHKTRANLRLLSKEGHRLKTSKRQAENSV